MSGLCTENTLPLTSLFKYSSHTRAKPASPTAYRVATMAAPGDRNSTSLRAILTQAKPQISCMKYTASKNTIGRWPLPKHDGIAEWSEFNLESLVESYGHILNREGPGGILAPDPPNNKIEISKVNHIRLLIEWNSRVIDMAQKFTKESLGIDTGVSLLNDVTTHDGSTRARIRTEPAKGAPAVDHVIALDDHPLTNLVVGLVKSHSRFPASVVVDNSHLTTTDQMWALGQLANLCHTAKTRYGYIMTDHALVACRYTIFKDPTYRFGRFKVALMPVPWSKRGPEQLTTDLALWWLCMLAASAPHNRSTLEHEMVPINKWEVKYYDDGRGWVRRHKYSGYEEPTKAPSPPPYETPAPDDVAGNAALFMAAVGGFNVQEDFDPNPPPIPGQPADLAQSYQHNPADVVVAYDGQGLSFDVANKGQDYSLNFDVANEGQDYVFNFDAANEGEDFDFNI